MKSDSYNSRSANPMKIGITLVILVAVCVAIFLLTRGKRTTTGEYPSSDGSITLMCTKKGVKYPKITNVDADNKEISIIAIFNRETELRSISLKYTLVYGSQAEAKNAEAVARFDFIGHLGGLGFDNGEFDNNFSLYDNNLVVSIYGDSKDLENEDKAGYFMLGTEAATKKNLHAISEMRKAYEKKSFSCESLKNIDK